MFDLFARNPQYDDDGNLVVNQVTLIESGEFSYDGITLDDKNSLTNMYDNNPNTMFQLKHQGEGSTGWIKWDFKHKQNFFNIYVWYWLSPRGDPAEIKLEGSNDNSNWTTIDSFSSSTGDSDGIYGNLLATNVTYRYIRLYFDITNTTLGQVNIHNVKGITDE